MRKQLIALSAAAIVASLLASPAIGATKKKKSTKKVITKVTTKATTTAATTLATTVATTAATTKATVPTGPLGALNKATGTPVTFGYVGEGKSEAIDNTPEGAAVKATAQYINEYQGGLNGHPIEIKGCETKSQPALATDCANQMVDAKVVGVITPVSGQQGAIFKALSPSGIPLLMAGGLDADTSTKPGAFILQNGYASAFAGPAGAARDGGIKKAALVVIDVPAASGPAETLGTAFYKNAGVAVEVVKVAPGTADMTPQIQAALINSPGQFALIGNPAFCNAAMKAIRTLAFTGPIYVIQQCIDASSQTAVPGGLKGVRVITSVNEDPDTPEYKVFKSVMDTYAKGTVLTGVTPGGYIATLGFWRALNGNLTGDVTAASVTAALKAMKPTPLPLGGGATFQCDGKQVSIGPNICSTSALSASYDDKGNVLDYKAVDVKELIKLG